jgi:hypothetical protein
LAGASFCSEMALMALKPARLSGVSGASAPPVIMMSASPRAMMRNESPIACDPVLQAVALAQLGPLAPKRIEIWPEASLMIVWMRKKGETRPGPFSRRTLWFSSMDHRPPMPEPT